MSNRICAGLLSAAFVATAEDGWVSHRRQPATLASRDERAKTPWTRAGRRGSKPLSIGPERRLAMIEVELAFIGLLLLVVVWQLAGLQETAVSAHADLLRVLLENRYPDLQDPDTQRAAEWAVRKAKESVLLLEGVPRWR